MLNAERIRSALAGATPPGEGVPPDVTDTDLEAFSRRAGFELPEEVREWLKVSNAPFASHRSVACFLGIRPDKPFRDIENKLDLFPMWKAKGWVPVATDGCGNYHVVATRDEYGNGRPVLFVEAVVNPDVPGYLVASDLRRFVTQVIEDEVGSRWPFNRDEALAKDPNLAHFYGVPFPWDE